MSVNYEAFRRFENLEVISLILAGRLESFINRKRDSSRSYTAGKVSLLRTYTGEFPSRTDDIRYILSYVSYSLIADSTISQWMPARQVWSFLIIRKGLSDIRRARRHL